MPTFSLQFSDPEPESDDEVAPETRDEAGSAAEVEKHVERMASSSSGEEEGEENVNVVDSDAVAKGK